MYLQICLKDMALGKKSVKTQGLMDDIEAF